MPPSKAGKRARQDVPAPTATAESRPPKRAGRKRAREPVDTPETGNALAASDSAQPLASPTDATMATPTEGGHLAGHAPLVSSPSATPAGRSFLVDAPSTTPSSLSADADERDGGDAEVDSSGLVRSNSSSSAVLANEEAGNLHDHEALAEVRGRFNSIADKLRCSVELSISHFTKVDGDLERLGLARQKAQSKVEEVVQSRHPDCHAEVITLNVGGETFTVPLATLLGRDSPNYFHVLLGAEEAGGAALVFKDARHQIFIDRDPACFKHILSYFRGYQYFNLLKEDTVRRLKVDAAYFQLPGLLTMLGEVEREAELQFNPGPGVSLERNRLRVVYGVAVVGDVFLVTGRHTITYEVKIADYIGFGLVSEACVNTDQEFHKIPDCCVYYMSGVFYTNYPYHRKEENLERIENGDFVTMKVDLDKGYVEYILKNSRKMVSIGRARRLRFATTMKLASRVRIVPPDEVRRRLTPVHYTFDE